jgi:predicted RND superfamily exporter protein
MTPPSTLAELCFAALTELQIDRLIELAFKIVQGVGYACSIIIPSMVLYFQRRNARNIAAKVDASTEASKEALTVANSHNAKIANLTEVIKSHQSP